MTKGEIRKARKQAKATGQPLTGELAIPKNATASRKTKARKATRERHEASKAFARWLYLYGLGLYAESLAMPKH